MQPTSTELAILKTIAYFDVFHYPLTLFELWKNLPLLDIAQSKTCGYQINQGSRTFCGCAEIAGIKPAAAKIIDLITLEKTLKGSIFLSRVLTFTNGFYFLRGREEILKIRQAHYREALKKFRRAQWIIRFLKIIPSIKGIAICNSLGYANPHEKSDIDLIILTEPGRIWTSRALAVLLTKIFASRPVPEKTKDAICLSFFSVYNYNLESLKLKMDDPHFDWWVVNFLPVYDQDSSFESFFENNEWIDNLRPNAIPAVMAKRFSLRKSGIHFPLPLKHLTEKIFEKLQMLKMPAKIKEMANLDSRVILSNNVLKFHLNDKRAYYREELERRLNKILA